MTGSDLFGEIGNISEEFIVEAEQYKGMAAVSIRRKFSFQKTLTAAACLLICFGVVTAVHRMGLSTSDSAMEFAKKDAAAPMEVKTTEGLAGAGDTEGSFDAVTEECAEEMVAQSVANTGENGQSAANKQMSQGGTESAEREQTEHAGDETDNLCGYPEKDTISEQAAMTVSGENTWDVAAIRERLSGYPDEYEALLKEENVLMVVHGRIEAGENLWSGFEAAVGSGHCAQIDVVCFTKEGDPIIKALYYDGTVFRICVDGTRDAFRGDGEAYYEEEFQYLQKVEHLSEDGFGTLEYVLTDSEPDSGQALSDVEDVKQPEYYSLFQITE